MAVTLRRPARFGLPRAELKRRRTAAVRELVDPAASELPVGSAEWRKHRLLKANRHGRAGSKGGGPKDPALLMRGVAGAHAASGDVQTHMSTRRAAQLIQSSFRAVRARNGHATVM